MPPKSNTPLEKETDESTILNPPQTEGPGSSGAAAIRVEGTDSMEDDNEQNGARKKTGQPGEASQGSDSTDPATGKAPQRRFLTRSGAARRKKQESCLEVAIHQLALDLNPDNLGTHEQFLKQMLRDLEQDHLDYVAKENLDINLEPKKSYLSTFIRKVDKALEKHKARLQVATPFPSAPPAPTKNHTRGHGGEPDLSLTSRIILVNNVFQKSSSAQDKEHTKVDSSQG